MDVALIDSGGANIGSVRYALERLGANATLTADAETIRSAERVILPGVGAAAPAMARLRELGLVELIRDLNQPLLGICLGMQLLFESSEEGDVECLGLLPGRIARLPASPGIRVPHMGWNTLDKSSLQRSPLRKSPLKKSPLKKSPLQRERESGLLAGIDDGAYAYFVHSYAAPVTKDTLAVSEHGGRFAAMVGRGRCFGAQFHPERSAAVGARLLENFLREVPA